jgi:hypothetical protein
MGLLETYNSTGSKSDKEYLHKYISSFYAEKLNHKQYDKLNILEIGIHKGYSIKLWEDFFINSKIYGVDIYLNEIEEKFTDRTTILNMNAYSQECINYFIDNNIKFDIIIEDGPHTFDTQEYTIRKYTEILNDTGLLVIEDIVLENAQPLKLRNPEITIVNLSHIAWANNDNVLGFIQK